MSDGGFLLACRGCGRRAFLIRLYCEDCWPALFAAWRGAGAAYFDMARRFEAATGREPLEDWYGFEAFVSHQPDVAAYTVAVLAPSRMGDTP